MFYEYLTGYQKLRFNRNNICPICGEEIKNNESFELVRVNYSRNTYYSFIHQLCILEKVGVKV